MLGKTHLAVGIGAGLALLHPGTLTELVIGTGACTVGAIISDIDVDSSDSHKGISWIIGIAAVAGIGICAAEYFLHLGLRQKLFGNTHMMKTIGSLLIFLVICAFGKEQPHRSFMHSFLALGLLAGCLQVMLPMAVPYFAVAFLSHLLLDLLNFKRERLLYPLKGGLCLKLCHAQGTVDRILLGVGTLASVVFFTGRLLEVYGIMKFPI